MSGSHCDLGACITKVAIMSAHRVAYESHHPHPGATRRSAPLHSARATNAAAYYLYLNVTRLLAVGLKRRGLNGIKRSCPVCMHSPTVQRQICGR